MNRWRSPSSSTRRSFTRGARTCIVPAPQVTVRDCARPLRTTSRRPFSSRAAACALMYRATSSSMAAISMRRAPSRATSSRVATAPSVDSALSSVSWSSTFNMGGVSFPPGPLSQGVSVVHVEGYATCLTPPIHNIRLYLSDSCATPNPVGARVCELALDVDDQDRPRGRWPVAGGGAGPLWSHAPRRNAGEALACVQALAAPGDFAVSLGARRSRDRASGSPPESWPESPASDLRTPVCSEPVRPTAWTLQAPSNRRSHRIPRAAGPTS